MYAQGLSKGDLVVVGFNGDADPDEIALLALADISTSETFYLTDYPVTSTGGFTLDVSNGTNGSLGITPTSTITAGTIFTISIASGTASVSVSGASVSTTITGWTSTSSAAPSGNAGDAWHLFQGSGLTSPTNFIFAFANTSPHNSVWNPLSSGGFASTESYLGNGLTNGVNAIDIGGSNHTDNLYYSGSFASGTAADILARVVNTGNYTGDNSTTFDITVDGSSVFNGGGVTSNPGFTISGGAPTSLAVASTVFLEGAYNGTNLNTTINSQIPDQQPYNGVNSHSQSTTGTSIPSGAVDWVLVELREAGTAAGAVNSTRKGSTAGFLMNDGTIKATDGTSNLTINLTGNTGTAYYVVVYHRNHLPIMSANAIDGSGGTLTIDFTSNSANTYQTTTALASLTNNKFGMPSGDVNQDGSINSTDLSTWRTNNGAAYSYSGNGSADFNLDGEINAVDRNDFQQKNTSKTRQVPTT
ncbi:hypothetical protein BFP71_00055 [Roseivirga misakiensis]|uniref:Dockerin domain-containing protein n=1 Tax=Roseivirga misakiensis TaxID=1563681 RepID=A0A1E5T7V5_9BACT|nr:hypothetical protein BFP71_00055 [Roseivirga misakiensis]